MILGELQTPRCCISSRNIQQAYVFNSRRQKRRISIYGEMNRRFLKSLFALEKKTQPEGRCDRPNRRKRNNSAARTTD